MKYAEKGLIWALIHNTGPALDALAELDAEDLESLACREIFELARSLATASLFNLPITTLLQRLGLSGGERPTRSTSIAANAAVAGPGHRVFPRHQRAQVGAGACRASTQNRPPAVVWAPKA